MRKFRFHPGSGTAADYDRLGATRDVAMRRFEALAPSLGVSPEMIASPCAVEAMDRLAGAMVDLSFRNPLWSVQHPASLNDMASEMLPGLLRSACPDLLKINLVDEPVARLAEKMDSLCQLHRRDVVMVRVLSVLRELAASQSDHEIVHPAFHVQRPQLTVAFSRSSTES